MNARGGVRLERKVARPSTRALRGEAALRPAVSVIVIVSGKHQGLDELYLEYRSVFDEFEETVEFLFVAEPGMRAELKQAQSLASARRPVRVFEVATSMGESSLLLLGRDQSRGSILVTLPAYRRIEPKEILRLVERVREGVALVSAVRIPSDDDHFLNRLQRRAFHFLLRRLVGARFRDVACGVRVMRPEVLYDVPLYGDAFRFLPLLAAREGFDVEEIEVAQHARDQHLKVYSPGTYLRRFVDLVGMAFLSRFTQKPLRFFGLIGSTLALSGGLVLVVTVLQRFAGTPLANRPALVLGVLLVVLGLQAIALGLIGEIIVHFSVGDRPGYRLAQTQLAGEGQGSDSTELTSAARTPD